MPEPVDMILPLLREMRAETQAEFADIRRRFDDIDARLGKIDATNRALRQAMTTDSLMSKFLLGDFEERLASLEQKVDDLAQAKP
jgi:hypothetical protein